mmetsp:Transcript_143704/g.400547  ORF Transcript_143704/g.400547 Transcript_143704/m.400547 type:complete len:230 (-) Transcript_143704:364-1053(-)
MADTSPPEDTTKTAVISSMSAFEGYRARASSTRDRATLSGSAGGEAHAATASRDSTSQRPSDATTRALPASNGAVTTSGSGRTPSLQASKSPSARDIASPGKPLLLAKTRRTAAEPPLTAAARTTPPHARIRRSASSSSLWSWVAYETMPPRATMSVESPTCAVVTFWQRGSTSATEAVVPEKLQSSCCFSSAAWQSAKTLWRPAAGPPGSARRPGACSSKRRLTWPAT